MTKTPGAIWVETSDQSFHWVDPSGVEWKTIGTVVNATAPAGFVTGDFQVSTTSNTLVYVDGTRAVRSITAVTNMGAKPAGAFIGELQLSNSANGVSKGHGSLYFVANNGNVYGVWQNSTSGGTQYSYTTSGSQYSYTTGGTEYSYNTTSSNHADYISSYQSASQGSGNYVHLPVYYNNGNYSYSVTGTGYNYYASSTGYNYYASSTGYNYYASVHTDAPTNLGS